MDKTAKISFFSFILILMISGVSAAPSIIYKWVNDKGVITYSHDKPLSGKYTEVKITNQGKVESSKEKAIEEDNDEPALAEALSKRADEFCTRAKHNLNILTAFDEVKLTGSDGTVKTLSPDELKEQQALAEKQIKIFCK